MIFLERCLYLEMDVYVRGRGSDAGTKGVWSGFLVGEGGEGISAKVIFEASS